MYTYICRGPTEVSVVQGMKRPCMYMTACEFASDARWGKQRLSALQRNIFCKRTTFENTALPLRRSAMSIARLPLEGIHEREPGLYKHIYIHICIYIISQYLSGPKVNTRTGLHASMRAQVWPIRAPRTVGA